MSADKYSCVFDICLREMFLRVGEKADPAEFAKQPSWYRLHSWTEEQEKEFQEWMINFLRKKLKTSKKQAILETAMFILNYGWTTARKFECIGIVT